jgi:hypothetical protein
MKARPLIGALVAVAAIGALPATAAAHGRDPATRTAVVHWNEILQREVVPPAPAAPVPPPSSFAMTAFVQLAVYNAVVAIEGGYEPYGRPLAHRPRASVDAAVATAAHDVLVHYVPADAVALDADLVASLGTIPDGRAKRRGEAVGREAAAALIAQRQGDGWMADIGFTMPAPAPGVWQLPAGQSPLVPWLSKLRPFTLHTPDQFRPGPPPALDSRRYKRDAAEVEAVGGAVSEKRTPDQTLAGKFYMTHPALQYASAYREVAEREGLSGLQTARLMAMGTVAAADAQIACYDAKFTYLAWRPVFAIPGVTPLIPTPAHPEYPSGHSCMTFAQSLVFQRFLGTRRIDLDLPSTVPGVPARHFATTEDLESEILNARVWGGIHFRFSTETGGALGRRVAEWALAHEFRPRRGSDR